MQKNGTAPEVRKERWKEGGEAARLVLWHGARRRGRLALAQGPAAVVLEVVEEARGLRPPAEGAGFRSEVSRGFWVVRLDWISRAVLAVIGGRVNKESKPTKTRLDWSV